MYFCDHAMAVNASAVANKPVTSTAAATVGVPWNRIGSAKRNVARPKTAAVSNLNQRYRFNPAMGE